MHAPCVSFPTASDQHKVSIVTSPQQTLTFKHSPSPSTTLAAQETELERDSTTGKIIANTGRCTHTNLTHMSSHPLMPLSMPSHTPHTL